MSRPEQKRPRVTWGKRCASVEIPTVKQDDPNERFEAFTLKHKNGDGGVTTKFLRTQARIPAAFSDFAERS